MKKADQLAAAPARKDLLRRRLRFVILLIACLVLFSDYYCIDIPAVLKSAFLSQIGVMDANANAEYIFDLFYSVYSFPNIVLPFLGGLLVDRLGDRVMTIVFSLLLTAGQLLFQYGASAGNIAAMIAGRLVFGLGGESINITVMTILYRYFKGSELAFAQGLNVSLARISTVLSYNLSPLLLADAGLPQPLKTGALLCAISSTFAILLALIDSKLAPSEPSPEGSNSSSFGSLVNQCRNLPKAFWAICTVTMTLYLTVLPFNQIASTFFIERWLPKDNTTEVNEELAARLMSIPFIISAVLFPFVGLLVDKFGRRVNLLLQAGILLLATHISFMFFYPAVPLIFLGLSYSLFGAIVWPTVAYIVQESALGTAYGIQTSVQNLGLTLAPMAIGFIRTYTQNFNYVIAFFIALAIISIALVRQVEDLNFRYRLGLNEVHPKKPEVPGSEVTLSAAAKLDSAKGKEKPVETNDEERTGLLQPTS
eukprot:TRINITY_DN2680_c0_g3_i1.p1 TRINITY_DN2680_c0_g3~~TRINITY_DN2680_c0_g3_i1.p1  ORF type:complete len:481 (-),score=131.68 TRINITY_DN2680_c0_g3_i1:93-1535(-)